MKKFFRLLASIAFMLILAGSFMPTPTFAATSDVIPTLTEKLADGWTRISPYITEHVISTGSDGSQVIEEQITSAPVTLDDNKTLIDNTWYAELDLAQQPYFQNGNNVFTAKITGGRVSTLDKNGKLATSNSLITINSSYSSGNADVVDDPVNGQKNSALAWQYSKTITRYLRSNNGVLSELWKITSAKTDITFRPTLTVESDYDASVTPAVAFDSNGLIIPIQHKLLPVAPVNGVTQDYYFIAQSDLKNAKFPVYIDPTENYSVLDDAWIQPMYDSSYTTVHNATTGTVIDSAMPAYIGQSVLGGPYYYIDRSFVEFTTTDIPTNATISSATLYLYGYADYSTADFSILVASGQPTYPHYPIIATDVNISDYNGAGSAGYNTAQGWSTTSYNAISVIQTSSITKGGTTKLALLSSNDYNSVVPTTSERVAFWQAENGIGTAPILSVVYSTTPTTPTATTLPASVVTETTATLSGQLISDGGDACSVRFDYGTTTGYGTSTAWYSGYTAGQNFSFPIAGLSPGTTYHYRVVASNGGGTGYGTDSTFTTIPYMPTYFSATGGNGTVALTWTKGSGANTTYIVRKVGSAPATPSDGTTVYDSTGSSTSDNTVTNGVTYYYAAWSKVSGPIYSTSSAVTTATPLLSADPTVTTGSASGVTITTAVLQGTLTNLGGYASTDVWFQYYTGAGTWTDNSTTPQTLTAPGTVSTSITGLSASTTYHFRAAAQNTHGTSYGASVDLATSGNSAPTMTTNAATGLLTSSAQLNGTVTSDGGLSAGVTVWFQYGTTTNYELGTTPTSAGCSTGDTFYYGIGSLVPNTLYHYRAVGQNTVGITYGADVTFTTATPSTPTVTTNPASSVGAVQVTLNGTVVTDGGSSVSINFEWGTDNTYGNSTALKTGYSAGQTFNAVLTGLTVGTTYHFRADATNIGGSGYGTDATFTTVFTAPTNFVATAVSADTINLTWTLQGDQVFINYKTTGYPVDRNDGTQVYFGSLNYTSLSGLLPGTTYYFSAWSWKTGDVWTSTNSNAIATTQGAYAPNQQVLPPVSPGSIPTMSTSWFQVPSNAVVRQLPLYDVFAGWATAYQLPEGTFLAGIAVLISVIIGALIFMTFGGQAITTIAASLIALVLCTIIGMCPGIFAIIVGVIEVGAGYGLMSLGGNISGR